MKTFAALAVALFALVADAAVLVQNVSGSNYTLPSQYGSITLTNKAGPGNSVIVADTKANVSAVLNLPAGVSVLRLTQVPDGQAGAISPVLKSERIVRVATAAALATYSRVGTVITASANGAMASVDGVSLAVGDRLLLTLGASATDNGIYVVTSLGATGAPFILTRAGDWSTLSIASGALILTGSEGTAFPNSTWLLNTAGPIVPGTTSVSFVPRTQKGTSAALSGTPGVITISSVWLNSTTASQIFLTENTSGGTLGFLKAAAASRTAMSGAGGNGSFVIASSANETSTVDWLIVNF